MPDKKAKQPPPEQTEPSAAELDARRTLEAGGILRIDNVAALEQLARVLPKSARRLYTIDEACELINISPAAYYRARKDGFDVPARTVIFGTIVRISPEALIAWIERNTEPQPVTTAAANEPVSTAADLPTPRKKMRKFKPVTPKPNGSTKRPTIMSTPSPKRPNGARRLRDDPDKD